MARHMMPQGLTHGKVCDARPRMRKSFAYLSNRPHPVRCRGTKRLRNAIPK